MIEQGARDRVAQQPPPGVVGGDLPGQLGGDRPVADQLAGLVIEPEQHGDRHDHRHQRLSCRACAPRGSSANTARASPARNRATVCSPARGNTRSSRAPHCSRGNR